MMMNDGFLSQEEIDALLRGGESGASSPAKAALSEIEKDALGEIGNISMGSAATTLSILLGRKVNITTPKVSISTLNAIRKEYPLPYLIVEVGYTVGIMGTNLLAIREQDALIIADLMMGGDGSNPPGELNDLYISAVTEAMNQMMGSVATSMSTVFRKKVDITPPAANRYDLGVEPFATNMVPSADDELVRVSFRMEVEELIDSEIMQIIPLEVARDMVNSLMNAVQEPAAPAKAPQAPQPAIQTPPVSAAAAPPQQPMYQPDPNAGYGGPQMMMPPPNKMHQPSNVTVQPVQFAPLKATGNPGVDANLNLILDVPLQVTVELGRTRKLIRDILELTPGSVVELDKLAGEPVDILVNGKIIAKGEVVVIDESFGVRVTSIISPWERAQSLQ